MAGGGDVVIVDPVDDDVLLRLVRIGLEGDLQLFHRMSSRAKAIDPRMAPPH
jgi:hypothetical protein